MRCAGCNAEIRTGDHYIEDTASGFMGNHADPEIDDLLAGVMSGGKKIVFCENCTEAGGRYKLKTFYGI